MGWLQRLFGKRPAPPAPPANAAAPKPPAAPSQASGSAPGGGEPVFSRHTPNLQAAAPGQERATFLQKAAAVFAADATTLDAARPLQDGGYGCDELDVSELVQIAEEVWAVQLNPNPMRTSDFAAMVKRFPTLGAIMSEAEDVAAERCPRS
jgi:hypothetical protein